MRPQSRGQLHVTHANMYLLLLVYCNADPGYVIPANEGGRQTERPPGFAQVKLDFIAFLLDLKGSR